MPTKPARFNVKQAFLILLLVSLWIFAWVLLLFLRTTTSGVYPPLWVFSSAITLLLWLLYRFHFSFIESLKLLRPQFVWLLIGIMLALLYWQFDQWLIQTLKPARQINEIANWQNSIKGYWIFTAALSSVLLAPLFEELFFRGLMLSTLQRLVSDWLAIVISALLFAMVHWSWPEFISLFSVGVIYGWLTIKSNSLIPALLAHVIHNALTFWLYASF